MPHLSRDSARDAAAAAARAPTSRDFAPDAIHIATEGPLGVAASGWCKLTTSPSRPPTTRNSRNTCASARRFPESWSYAYLRRHHGRARRTLVATEHQRRDLVAHGFANVVLWSRGVDAGCSSPAAASICRDRGRSGSMRAASRSRRTSTPSWRSTCPAVSRRRRRPGSRRARARAIARRAVRRLQVRRGSRPTYLQRGRVRVPEPHRTHSVS